MTDESLAEVNESGSAQSGRGTGDAGNADLQAAAYLRAAYKQITRQLEKVVFGQRSVIKQMLVAMFSGGHCLVVGVPGLAKTLTVRTLAEIFDLEFSRIQFTPDLMPSDILGTDIIQEDPETQQRGFTFLKGPIFANIILADEINRTPPKTQSALLEAMQEYHVTAGRTTHGLPMPFFVLATQNPIEQEGTYPLPEAQQDRFMFQISIDYPDAEDEMAIATSTTLDRNVKIEPVMGAKEILKIQRIVRRVPVTRHVTAYATNLVRATRPRREEAPDFVNEYLIWGAGPRATQYLILAGKAIALLSGRCAVNCRDIRSASRAVLRHRISTNFSADAEGLTPDAIIQQLLETVPEPSEKDYR